ncbi:Ent-kaurene synthase [Karstenula rhodostoma CBS 690.94]|uniref:Ent-kaurene synthase n=1 Tax=Karstenula rhodostoma CBS 690.94 TaxID=1392251 RepID=A0A9P4U636_9PLEO|nr:Ent-kaurene synthase [Karstenula rhodostoma CBS 690.94]
MDSTNNNPRLCPSPNDIIADLVALDDDIAGAPPRRFGSFSGAIYDTAWLSMIRKKKARLFLECFEYLLAAQQESGVWGSNSAQIDIILNSLAALLALVTQQRSTSPQSPGSSSLHARIERGQLAVQAVLQNWAVQDSVHVGFEILVPSLLNQLSACGIVFDFPGHSTLMQLHKKKLQKFKPASVYSTQSTTLLHSIEALVGLIDFDRVSHHCKEDTGIFGSPSATAAYLIHSTTWDQNAESYLSKVVSSTGGTGHVPSAYPTCVFELSWSLSTLLTPRVSSHAVSAREKDQLALRFERTLEAQSGLVGFTPGVLEDADDTARSLMALRCLGKNQSARRLIEIFEAADHFRTYRWEGSPSFSANCNVLLALLGEAEGQLDQENIKKTLAFLLNLDESGPIHDKWNMSAQYSRMLFVQVLVLTLEKYNAGHVEDLASKGFAGRIPGAICRQLSQTLSDQKPNGSWDDSLEITSYSIITVGYALSLPWSAKLKDDLRDSIRQGQDYVRAKYSTPDKTDFLWVEKVSYRSLLLHSVYCSAALHLQVVDVPWTPSIADGFALQQGDLKKTQNLISSLPLFRGERLPSLELVLVEARLMAAQLKLFRNSLFSRSDIPMTADKYLEFIPMIWVACNHKNGQRLSYKITWEMVLLSLLNFQVDEYMESVVARVPQAGISLLMGHLKDQSKSASMAATKTGPNFANGLSHADVNPSSGLLKDTQVHGAFKALSRFMQHVTQHWSLTRSPVTVQQEMGLEIYNFIHAHNEHNRENALLATRKVVKGGSNTTSQPRTSQEQSYIQWVRGTASDDTSCPFSFLFVACLISKPGKHCFDNPRAQYFSKSLCRHLATMCRQYNDYGSAARDAEEGKLNSLNFLGFCNAEYGLENDCPAKDSLMALAEFERAGMELAMDRLSSVVPRRCIEQLQVFIDVTDMFGQVYIQKDIASRVV